MRIYICPHVEAHFAMREFSKEHLTKYPTVEIPDDDARPLAKAIQAAIRQVPGSLSDDSRLDAPGFSKRNWWISTVQWTDAGVELQSMTPGRIYAVADDGRVRFEQNFRGIRVRELSQALREQDGGPSGSTIVVTRAGEFGGNGVLVPSILQWLWQFAPEFLVALVPRI